MKFYKGLYVGESIKDPVKVKRQLKLHKGTFVYVICIAAGNDQLEIFHSGYLKQKYYRKNPPIVIGIASDYKEAVDIVVKITQECVTATGNCNLKEYLKYKVQTI